MKPHEEWLFKAEQDLESSKFLLTSIRPLYDIIVYHSQQCAEKSIKAYFAYLDIEIDKTHNLMHLTHRLINIDISFESLKEPAEFLTPYATIFRYPIEQLLPTIIETKKAVDYSEQIFNFIMNKIMPSKEKE